jgi:hypothetical protein
MTVTLKANKSGEARPQRPCFPSISSGDASNCSVFHEKSAFLKDIAESRDNIPVSIHALMRAFACPRSRVQAALAHGMDEPGQRAKPIALDQDREQQILDWIRQNAEQDTSVTRGEIMDYSTSQFKMKYDRG